MKLRSIFLTCSILATLLQGFPSQAQDNKSRTLIAVGGNISENIQGFFDMIIPKVGNEEIRILLLDAYDSNPSMTSEAEHNEYLRIAEEQRSRLEAGCRQSVSPDLKCNVTLIPVFGQPNAYGEGLIEAIKDHPTAIIFLGDESTAALQAMAGTPVENAMFDAYQDGVIIGGAGGTAGILSTSMIDGYKDDFEPNRSLNFGAVNVWRLPQRQILFFGLQNVLIDAHFYEQNRLGRLLNAITLPDTPHIGIGIDEETGVRIVDEDRLENVFGQNMVTILDADTYHSAEAVRYQGPEHLLSIRNVILHVLSAGEFTYSLQARQHSLTPIQNQIKRSFETIALPPRAGSVIVTSNLYEKEFNDPMLTHFLNLCGGQKADVLVVATGYSEDEAARKIANNLIDKLNVPGSVFVTSLNTKEILKVSKETTGIIIIGSDQTEIPPQSIAAIRNAWISGTPLLADGSASAILGNYYVQPVAPQESDGSELSNFPSSFHLGDVEISPGLNILNLSIEPQVFKNNRWRQFYSLAYQYPNLLTFGLAEGAALEFSSRGAMAQGDNVILALDLSKANLDVGTNQGIVIANGLLDVFAPGDPIEPENADIAYAPISNSTPSISTATPILPTLTITPVLLMPSPTSTEKPGKQNGLFKNIPSKTPRPASVQPNIPPADPNLARLIIGAGILIVMVVILGVWINRQRLR